MVSVVMAKADPGGKMRGMHPPTSRFQKSLNKIKIIQKAVIRALCHAPPLLTPPFSKKEQN